MPLLHRLRLATAGRLPGFAKASYLKLREIDAGRRALPDFLIIGAMKAGTTSLFNYLCLHPQVIGSVPKEILYFCSQPQRNARWYRRHFPTRQAQQRAGALCGEASPTYLPAPNAPAHVRRLVPQIKLIVLLREPAARSVSHYYHRHRAGREPRTIDDIFTPAMIARVEESRPHGETENLLYERSDYATALRRWLEIFPRDQIQVLEAETLFAQTQATLDSVTTFLGLEPMRLPAPTAYNTAGGKTQLPRHFDQLVAAFAKVNKELPALGYPMSWMPHGR